REGIEPPTPGFSVLCSTNWATCPPRAFDDTRGVTTCKARGSRRARHLRDDRLEPRHGRVAGRRLERGEGVATRVIRVERHRTVRDMTQHPRMSAQDEAPERLRLAGRHHREAVR